MSIGGCGSNERTFHDDANGHVAYCCSPSYDNHSGELHSDFKTMLGCGIVDSAFSYLGECRRAE